MGKAYIYFFLSFFFIEVSQAQASMSLSISPTADFQAPFCYKVQNRDEKATREYTEVIRLYKATFKDIFDKESVWDQDYLRNNPHVVEALRDFQEGKRAQTLKKIDLEGKTAKSLHKELLDLGFVWRVVPLRASFKKHTYWLWGGQTSRDPHHKRVVTVHVYIHQDGSLVRLKSTGIPDIRATNPRRASHVVKAVLLNVPPSLCKPEGCHYDTSYQNEAFKVTNDNQPVPKAPSQKFGLKLPKAPLTAVEQRQTRVIQNVVMNLAHTNLKTTCPLPVE